ncbi:E3 ubiquitin-protein ligase RNF181 homolog [Momordica charantia]|uniref:E3 ubiquitin-protein ligase RNF181 homolog n=1 Tax=Momordica charantia TaxID=3673 RepID=A0A6J1BT35_MOMCH|nr:E3 ubiquitin-protein ligase RNF181 homolog [Momordica charantia]
MVYRKIISSFYNFVVLKLYPGIKDALFCGDVIESHVKQRAKKEGCEALAHPTLYDAVGREWCSVCLSKVMEGEESRVLRLPCLHEFHKICIKRWFHECQKTCPICQFWLRDDDGQTTEVLTEEMVIWFTSFHVVGY